MILSFTWKNCWVRLAHKTARKRKMPFKNKMHYVMGLDVKKVLVILKSPKRGAFLLSREKLQKQTKTDLWNNMKFTTTKIHTHQSIPLFYHHWRVGCRRHYQQEENHQQISASQLLHLLQCRWWHLCHCRDCHLQILLYSRKQRILLYNRKQCL